MNRTFVPTMCLLWSSAALAQGAPPVAEAPDTISVTGTAERYVAADVAEILVDLQPNPMPAPEAVNGTLDALEVKLREVVKKHGSGATAAVEPSAWYGYTVMRTWRLTTSSVAATQPLLAGLTGVNGLRVRSVDYQSGDLLKHKRATRRQAADAAREKAEEYATALGRKLGPAVTIDESHGGWWGGGYWGYGYGYGGGSMANSTVDESRERGAAAPPGKIRLQESVRVTFRLL